MITILYIGANSNIGRSLVKNLKENYTVITAGRTNSDIIFDLEKPESIEFGNLKFDLLIHGAAHFGGTSISNAAEEALINTLSSITLYQKAIASGAKGFIHLSSIFTVLDTPSNWYNAYTISKRHAEEWLLFLTKQHPIDLLILRPTMIYSDDLSFAKHQSMPYFFIDQALRGIDIHLYGDGSATRNYMHISDLTDILGRCIEMKITGVYNCLHPENLTILEMAEIARSASKSKVQIIKDINKPNPESLNISIDKIFYSNISKTEFMPFTTGMKLIYETNYLNGYG